MGTASQRPPAGEAARALELRRADGLGRFRLVDVLEQNTFVVIVLAIGAGLHALFARGGLASDGWYTLLGGRIVSRSGLPHHDTLAVLTHGRDWVDQQWLAQLGVYGLWAAGGWPLVLLSMVVFYLAAFALVAAAARVLGASERNVAIVVLFCFSLGLSNTAMRAQVPAYVLFAAVLFLLLSDERRPSRRVFLVFPILALWANVHGSVVLGAGLVALRGATIAAEGLRSHRPRREWLPVARALIALPWLFTLVSPYALSLPAYYNRLLLSSNFDHMVPEWSPSTIRSEPFFFGVLLIASWIVFRKPNALTPFARLALACSGIGGMLAVRHIVWFALIATATVPSALDALAAPEAAPRHRRVNLALILAAVAAAVTAAAATARHSPAWFEQSYPRRASQAVSAAAAGDPSVKVFANVDYADWLLFENPQLAGRVAFDARLELLTKKQLETLLAFRVEQGLDWQRAARGYDVLVLDPVGEKDTVALFQRRPGTTVLFRDRHVVVLRRAPAR